MFIETHDTKDKNCTNISELDSVDGFKCDKCGIELEDWVSITYDEDCDANGNLFIEKEYHEYSFKYCPNCGRKVN